MRKTLDALNSAIIEMENMVDKKCGNYVLDPVAQDMAESIKETYRHMIVEKASVVSMEADAKEDRDCRISRHLI